MDCDHPECHDGRLRKFDYARKADYVSADNIPPKPAEPPQSPVLPWTWTQDDLNKLLEVVDALASVTERLSFYKEPFEEAQKVRNHARALRRKVLGS